MIEAERKVRVGGEEASKQRTLQMNPQLNKYKKQAIQHLLEGIPQLAGGSPAANVKRENYSELMFLK